MTPPRPVPPRPPLPPAHRGFEAEDILCAVRNSVRRHEHARKSPSAADLCPIAPRELPPGTQLRGHTIKRVQGTGGFAVAYLAEENATGRRVVIKEHFPEYLCYREAESLNVRVADENKARDCEAARASFLREHHLLSTLQHPHLPRASTCFEAHNTPCYTAEYIEGITLGELAQTTARQQPLPQKTIHTALVRLLDTLDYLHSKGLLHRDIKPENILITPEGLPMLIDFGAAHELHRGEPDYIVEAPGFSPAEQSQEKGRLGPWTDIYALGATFHYLLTGHTLPPARQREHIDLAIPLAQRHHLRPHYHPQLLASIDRATRPRASERYQCAREWLADLRK